MKTFIKEAGNIKFLYEMEKELDHSITFNVYEVNSWIENKETGVFDVPSDTELYLKAYMKWDGCYHFWFGESDGYLHLCGNSYVKSHIDVMNKCIEFAKTKIKCYDAEIAE